MNKAFVKDDDTWEDPEIELDPEADIPAGSRNYMTPQGAARLREEFPGSKYGRRVEKAFARSDKKQLGEEEA